MKKLLIILTLFFSLYARAQTEKCGFDLLQEHWFSDNPKDYDLNRAAHINRITRFRQQNPNPNYLTNPNPPSGSGNFLVASGCPQATYIIPVVVHVIRHPGVPATNLDTLLIQKQIDILNKAFRNDASTPFPSVNTGIQFCLAKRKPDNTPFNGIIYTTSTQSNHTVEEIQNLAALSYFPAERYLNLYVVKRITFPSSLDSAVVGYSTPVANQLKYEGVVVDYNWFGSNAISSSPFHTDSKGHTLIHEIGHYLGLFHPFQGACAGSTKATCATDGDLCCDVPQVAAPNPTCSNSLNTCFED